MTTMFEFIQRLPKAELHLHLEGSIQQDTLLEIRPELSASEVASRYQYDSFQQFLKNFGWIAQHLREPSDYAIATRRLLEHLEEQNVIYAEITLSAGVVLWKKQNLQAVHDAVRTIADRSPVKTFWIWDAVRQWGVEHAHEVARHAAAHAKDGVIAFGLGGDETNGPARDFTDVFRYAKDHGLRLVCHAGEAAGADSVWQALEIGAERIGHGIRAIEDPALVQHLAAHRIPLEVSISSNVCTGAVRSLKDHPVLKLHQAGVPIVLCTDDPPMFHTTLCREFQIAYKHFGFTPEELEDVAQNAFRFRFKA